MNFKRIFLALGFLTLSVTGFAQKAERPNIIVILADDLGYGDLSCYNPASAVKTRNIDALASQGLRFTDAHSPSSVCTPTRYAMLTGRYAWRGSLKKGVLLPWDPPLIEKDRLTLPQMLKQTGYATYAVGKWHLGWNWQKVDKNAAIDKLGNNVDFQKPVTGGPVDYGFNYYFGDDVPNYPPYTYFENDRLLAIPTQMKPDTVFGNPGIMKPGWNLESVMPTITAKAVDVIEKASGQKDKPFFLYFALTAPHTPIAPARDFKGKSKMGPYGDFLMEVDWSVGQIMEALKANHLDDNTLVIFTSDNGSPGLDGTKMGGVPGSLITKYQHNTNLNLRGLKGDIWEGGHRIPLIVRYGNKTPAGEVAANPVVLLDIMATVAEITGIKSGKEAMEDSKSFLSVLSKPGLLPNAERPLVHHAYQGQFAIRKGDWKLIMTNISGGFSDGINKSGYGITTPGQLYNLRDDLAETTNLYDRYPDKVEQLSKLLEEIKKQ